MGSNLNPNGVAMLPEVPESPDPAAASLPAAAWSPPGDASSVAESPPGEVVPSGEVVDVSSPASLVVALSVVTVVDGEDAELEDGDVVSAGCWPTPYKPAP